VIKGVVYALSACFIWGCIFVVPLFMEGFSTIEIALGRYIIYGALSSLILLKSFSRGLFRYSKAVWYKSLYFSFACTMGYYTFVILSIRHSTPDICALVLGIAPIAIAFYGNWRQKETSFKSLVLPSVLIVIGLAIINIPPIVNDPSPASFAFGIACSLIALGSWTWYVVANARFLRQNPHVNSADWSTLVGVSSLFWVFLFGMFFSYFFNDQLDVRKCLEVNADFFRFLIGCGILGFFCSWVGAYLWNRASLYLPVALAGQMMIFETIFGVLFVYLVQRKLPPFYQCIGILILLLAILYGMHCFSKRIQQRTE
jgi:drug/metabolite transporter (DMT)-like permease